MTDEQNGSRNGAVRNRILNNGIDRRQRNCISGDSCAAFSNLAQHSPRNRRSQNAEKQQAAE